MLLKYSIETYCTRRRIGVGLLVGVSSSYSANLLAIRDFTWFILFLLDPLNGFGKSITAKVWRNVQINGFTGLNWWIKMTASLNEYGPTTCALSSDNVGDAIANHYTSGEVDAVLG